MKKLSRFAAVALVALAVLVGHASSAFAQAGSKDVGYQRTETQLGQIKPGQINQRDLVVLLQALRNRVWGITATGGAALSVGSTVAKIRTNSIINWTINGKTYGLASTDDLCTVPATTATGLTTGAFYRIEIDAAGACSVTAGPVGTVASGTLNGVILMPSRSANKATLGVLLVAGQVFTPGTTTTAASATVVYTNGDPDLIDLLAP